MLESPNHRSLYISLISTQFWYILCTKFHSLVESDIPLGVLRTRCLEDEALLKAIGETGGNNRTLYLLDARPRANALGNTVKGKGFENVGSYSNCKIEFLGL